MKEKNMSDIFKDKIDITMTSVLRPLILSETLKTIRKHICKEEEHRYRLIINVDPIGEDIDPMIMVKVARKNFKNVIYKIADKPSFSKAVKWVWSQVEAHYVFHWEDDVNILYDIDVDEMISILKKYKKLSSLRLFKAATPNKHSFPYFACNWRQQPDGFYLASDWKKQFGLNPILIKSEFVKEAVKRMVDNVNPEKQFRYSQTHMRPLIKKWQYGLFTKPGAPRMIDGRKGQNWKNQMGIDKPGDGRTFIEWVKRGKKK
jgi:hypothetical protein